MGADTLLTLLGLIIAAYAVLPVERQLDLKLRLKAFDLFVAGSAIFLILYIQFYPILSSLRVVPQLGSWKWGFDQENASLLIVLVAFTIVYFRAKNAKVQASTISTFRSLIERLISEEKYSAALFLLEQHYYALFRLYDCDFFQGSSRRLRTHVDFPLVQKSLEMGISRYTAWFHPVTTSHSETAKDVVRRCLLSEPFVSYLAKARPYFALELLSIQFSEREGFVNLYFESLLRDTKSILYHEIRHSQGLADGFDRRYSIQADNRLIFFYLADARVAERMEAWRPFGDFVVRFLDDLFYKREADAYNNALGSYCDIGRWGCPIYASIWFIDAMLLEALYQGVKWHMWLYYFPHFVERVLRNIRPDLIGLDVYSEWPTPYHYLLYAIFEAFRGWIISASQLSISQEFLELRSTMINHENDNIPKSSILALGICLRQVMLAKNIDTSFRTYLLEGVIRSYFGLLNAPAMQRYGELFRNVIVEGGFSSPATQDEYLANLIAALGDVDHIPFPHAEWRELVDLVNAPG